MIKKSDAQSKNPLNLQRKRILVVGDVMLDSYFVGEVKRISPEAPVPVFKKVSERSTLGGAANVAVNLVAAGQSVSVLTMLGNDSNGDRVMELMRERGMDVTLVHRVDWPTTTKVRFLAENNQQVMRLDEEEDTPFSDEDLQRLESALSEVINIYDAVIVSDYMKGLLTERFTQAVISMAKENGIGVYVDVKDPNRRKYRGATLIKPNLRELALLTDMDVSTEEKAVAASAYLLGECFCDVVLSTMGAKGMLVVQRGEEPVRVPATSREVFDVTGAGDTALAYLVACLANNIPMLDATSVANSASGVQISKVGTAPVYPEEVAASLGRFGLYRAGEPKAVEFGELGKLRENAKGKKIVFTNGCFDLLHVGHTRYLKQAAALGDMLVVGVNSDESVRRLKGESRPVNRLEDRIEMLASFDFIDFVVSFGEDTPLRVIKTLKPDVLVKGGDYREDEIIGGEFVKGLGGEVTVLPFVEGKSSTGLIGRILDTSEGVANGV